MPNCREARAYRWGNLHVFQLFEQHSSTFPSATAHCLHSKLYFKHKNTRCNTFPESRFSSPDPTTLVHISNSRHSQMGARILTMPNAITKVSPLVRPARQPAAFCRHSVACRFIVDKHSGLSMEAMMLDTAQHDLEDYVRGHPEARDTLEWWVATSAIQCS